MPQARDFEVSLFVGVAVRAAVGWARACAVVDPLALSMPDGSEHLHESLYLIRAGVPASSVGVHARYPTPILLPFALPFFSWWGTTLGRALRRCVTVVLETAVALVLRDAFAREDASDSSPPKPTEPSDPPRRSGAFAAEPPEPLSAVARPTTIALAYFLNPAALLSTACDPWQPLVQLCAIGALAAARRGQLALSACAVAAASCIAPRLVVLLLPVHRLLAANHAIRNGARRASLVCACFAACAAALVHLSCALVGIEPRFALDVVPGIRVAELTPGLGVAWYLFLLLYERFWHYFVLVVTAAPWLHVGPIVVRLWCQPMLMASALLVVGTLAAPQVGACDFAFVIALVLAAPLNRTHFARARAAALALVAVVCTLPMMWHLWLEAGSANANYFYFQSLVATALLHGFAMWSVSSAASASLGRRRDRAEFRSVY